MFEMASFQGFSTLFLL